MMKLLRAGLEYRLDPTAWTDFKLSDSPTGPIVAYVSFHAAAARRF